MHYQWIEHPDQLQTLAHDLQHSQSNALDTEFIKVDTLYPKLGLLQINVNKDVYLVDGHLDLSMIWDSIFKAKLNVFHACGEDVDLIYHYAKNRPLDNILDTQVAMSFLGYGRQVGYQAALEQVLNIHVDKDQTRSNWLARPLSEDQIRYAVSDVYYLQDLADQLISDLKQKQLYDLVMEDCHHYCLSLAEQTPLEDVYLDVANYRHNARQLIQLKQLATWREQLAIKLNQPRSFILKNNTINNILERTPRSLTQLAAFEIKPSILREHGKTILALLHDLPEKDSWPTRLARPYRFKSEKTKLRIDEKIAQVSQQLNIPEDVLMRKKWLTEITQSALSERQDITQLTPYLQGWRLNYLTQPLLEIISEEKGFDRV